MEITNIKNKIKNRENFYILCEFSKSRLDETQKVLV